MTLFGAGPRLYGVSRSDDSSAVTATEDLLDRDGRDRKRAAAAVAPFLFLGLFDLALLLGWGLNPLWGFLLLPPILFICVLAWVAFSNGFARDRTGDA